MKHISLFFIVILAITINSSCKRAKSDSTFSYKRVENDPDVVHIMNLDNKVLSLKSPIKLLGKNVHGSNKCYYLTLISVDGNDVIEVTYNFEKMTIKLSSENENAENWQIKFDEKNSWTLYQVLSKGETTPLPNGIPPLEDEGK